MNPADLDTFLHQLQFDTDKVKPPDWEVDWEDAPLAYKLYRGLPVVPLSPEVPLTLEGREMRKRRPMPDLGEIGHFLWYAFGLTQFCQSVLPADSAEKTAALIPSFRRFVPSGGALYPNELYVYLKLESLPAGVYHYDVAHHRLILLREGKFDDYLTRTLGYRCDLSACFGVVFVSTVFWKNFFKYHNFAYRLQGLDSGVLIGQLLEVSKRFRFAAAVCFQFLDRAVNHLLGLSEQEESVVAVIPLAAEPMGVWFADGKGGDGKVSSADLCRELAEVRHDTYSRSRRIKAFPMLIRMNEASMLDSVSSFRPFGEMRQTEMKIAEKKNGHEEEKGELFALPDVEWDSYDLAAVCRKRYSPETDFIFGEVNLWQLAVLLKEAAAFYPYPNDLDGTREQSEPRVSLYGCLHGVKEVPDGAYVYDGAAHALQQIRPGDHRLRLQRGMFLHNVNLFQVPICIHPAGDKDHLLPALGYRGYRIQQMEAGMLVQRLLLAACAAGMGGHPLLGYDANLCDELYKLAPQGKTSLIQIPIGPCRPRLRLAGGLHS